MSGGGRRQPGRAAAVVGLALVGVAAGAGPALAHPLGNFSINHHDTLVVTPDGVEVESVLDLAEIPTSQELPAIDTDGDGTASDAELAVAAEQRCTELLAGLSLRAEGSVVALVPGDASLRTEPGQADLPTLRLTCTARGATELAEDGTAIAFEDTHLADRLGWREVVAVGDGATLTASDVDAASTSDVLRAYPQDMLQSPLDVRGATLVAVPGGSTGPLPDDGRGGAADVLGTGDGFLGGLVARGDRLLQDTIGRDEVTAWVGGVAVLLALLLGAGHAALPGHGKTVMAAYLAGRDGTRTDALVVGATVTLTHTAGVLVLGLVLGLGSAVAGEVVLQRLGVVSGVLVAGIGASMLRDALRARRRAGAPRATVRQAARAGVGGRQGTTGHDHGHDPGHDHDHEHDHGHHHPGPRASRRGLVGMAMAGGLVPSPSALVVLLGSVALGRTLFGVGLVLAYGIGMAATLVAVGLVLVHVRDRIGRAGAGRLGGVASRLRDLLPLGTATLVLLVGVGLVGRALVVGA